MNEIRNATCDNLWNITNEFNLFNEENWKTVINLKLVNYQEIFIQKIREGYDGSDDPNTSKQWSFVGGIYIKSHY